MTTDKTGTERGYVVLASTMRSGSTLLKALLATAPDIAHLPENNFQKTLPSAKRRSELEKEFPEPFLLLKRPAWFHESSSYPRIPEDSQAKQIILLRDAYDTVRSVGRMLWGKKFDRFPGLAGQRLLARRYWVPITRNLVDHAERNPDRAVVVRYEDLLAAPEEETLRLFQFIGSSQAEGLRSYSTPETFKWKWGSDDGSPRIRTKEVQPPRPPSDEDRRRADTLNAIPEIAEIRKRVGYTDAS